ncbi:phosphatidylglycerophosphatase A family protein [Zavarzinia compransoris]|uniref:Phosphatidylglycerophosphatase A n=1 Tax=Zavarzinia compransoris TaxID=1264899 RepID=A0A317EAS3_9PROT|nr:phosphatidylglycerophosphatase A [Zavarzinia compransoris]PWR23791.1 phosphatidylglycerophosphatase A [Zavarzinia compransoris]TDP48023.1 phosphatidylglycerophosphatase A [Zavarzinia compransoris]
MLPLWHPARVISTGVFVGHIPGPAGTWGSAAALVPAWFIAAAWGPVGLAVAAALITAIGIWASGIYAGAMDAKDPGSVVVDEFAGQWFTLVLVPNDPLFFAIAFLVFRVLDIWKPWPASWADRSLPGGFGIVVDDVIAGLMGLVLMGGLVELW